MFPKFFFPSLVSLMACGCSIYPLPQDTTGNDTSLIVANVRCEARDAIRSVIIEQLESKYFAYEPVLNGESGNSLAARLKEKPSLFQNIDIGKMSVKAKKAFSYYRNSQIAYSFNLNIEESNADSVSIGLTRSFTRRRDDVALGVGLERSRNTTRIFNTVDTFGRLAQSVDDSYCGPSKSINIIYPIAGALPIRDLILNYIKLNEFDVLAGGEKNIFGTVEEPAIPQMGDTLLFVTKFSGSANPTSTLSPLGSGFLLSSIGYKNNNYRQDKHQLIITVSTAPDIAKLDSLNPRSVVRSEYDITRSQLRTAQDSLSRQRQRNFEDAVIQLGNSINRLTP